MIREEIEMYDHLPPHLAVKRAWLVAGKYPPHHKWHQDRLRQEWPLLARALDRLAHETNGGSYEH